MQQGSSSCVCQYDWLQYVITYCWLTWNIVACTVVIWVDCPTNYHLDCGTKSSLTTNAAINATINSLWPSDAIWRHRSGSTLAQVMACYLTAPSHYLNQCWLIISKIQCHSSEGNFERDALAIILTKVTLKITSLKFHPNLPGANELT